MEHSPRSSQHSTHRTEPATTAPAVMPAHAQQAFTQALLERVAHAISDVEATTHAEIRISIRDLREAGEAELTLRELAMKEFTLLGMHRTTGRVGILLLIMYHERRFYVYGDQGVEAHAHPATWTDVAEALRRHFAAADFEGGLLAALGAIEGHLRGALPERATTDNELTNDVSIR